MDALRKDVKYALTVLRRERGFSAAAILALALGIGATTAVFSVVFVVISDRPGAAGRTRRHGVCAGLAGALLLAQPIRGLLFGVTPADPLACVVAPLVLLPVAAMACLLPARRAAGAAPADVLRL